MGRGGGRIRDHLLHRHGKKFLRRRAFGFRVAARVVEKSSSPFAIQNRRRSKIKKARNRQREYGAARGGAFIERLELCQSGQARALFLSKRRHPDKPFGA